MCNICIHTYDLYENYNKKNEIIMKDSQGPDSYFANNSILFDVIIGYQVFVKISVLERNFDYFRY